MRFDQPIMTMFAAGIIGLPLAVSTYAQTGKIPVTTPSKEAKEAFRTGRELAEALRATDARVHFEKAVEEDPNFAWAHLALANTSNTANEFWASLDRAVELAEKASDGERLLILSFNAGMRSMPEEQFELCQRLVKAYPADERAQSALARMYFGRQENRKAIRHYRKATEINPDFASAYNQLGYAYRRVGKFDEAEKAFKKYIALIPDEPNPYDSYAELLMKLGRFQESIDNYQKALDNDRYFTASLVGIGNNYIFMGKSDKARATFRELYGQARNDGEKRQALFWIAASQIHEKDYDEAIETIREGYKIAEEAGDLPTMAGDLNRIATVLLESGEPDRAIVRYDNAVGMMLRSSVPHEAKEAARRTHLYNAARVALALDDLDTAKRLAHTFQEQAEAMHLRGAIRQAHRLEGMIALREKHYADAVAALSKANQENPRVLYELALAYQGQGANAQAREACHKAAHFNGLAPGYAFVRADALKMLEAEGD